LNVWSQGQSRIDTFSDARQLLGRITDEIKGAVASDQIQFIENVPGLKGTTAPQAKKSENIFFVAPYPNSGSGDLCAIAYRHNNDTRKLERGFVPSQDAWNSPSKYKSTGYDEWNWRTVSQGVLEFEIVSYSQDDLDNDKTPIETWDSSVDGVMSGKTPRRVVIRLKVVNDKTIAKLKGLSSASSAYTNIVNAAAREFTADVSLSQR
jgi:hypothetical protein